MSIASDKVLFFSGSEKALDDKEIEFLKLLNDTVGEQNVSTHQAPEVLLTRTSNPFPSQGKDESGWTTKGFESSPRDQKDGKTSEWKTPTPVSADKGNDGDDDDLKTTILAMEQQSTASRKVASSRVTLDKLEQASPFTTTEHIIDDGSPETSTPKEVEELPSSVIGTSAEMKIQVTKLQATTTERQKEAELDEENAEAGTAHQQKQYDELFQTDDDEFSMDERRMLDAAPVVLIACGCILFGGLLLFIAYHLRSSRNRQGYRQLHKK